jgi:ABC-type Mn2+/Zn2+ transport system ATPase subunit
MGTVPNPRPAPGTGARSAPEGASAHPAVDVREVSVRYGSIVAVDRATVSLPRGSVAAIIGPNGSGKSTLLHTISGLVRPDAGSVSIHGRALTSGAVAYVLQTNVTNESVPITVRETVRMGCYGRRGAFRRLDASDRAAVDEAMERMRITDIASRQLHELSGGQRQRVYVAQGLAQRAEVLLLDEPITGLDLVTQETVTEVIADERAQGRTVVLTTHDVGTARLADLVVLMATRVVAVGPPATTLTPEHLAVAYGGHVHLLDDGTVVLDEPHHHDHRHDDTLRSG